MEGPFVPSSLTEMLRDLYLAEQSGTLTVTRTEVRKRLHFDRGMIFLADSSLEDERVVDFLIRQGSLTEEGAREFTSVEREDPALPRTILNSGRVARQDLFKALQDLIQQVVISILRWDSGEFSFREGPPGGGDLFPTDVILTFTYIMRGIRSMEGFTTIREAMLRLDRPLAMNEALYLPLDKLTLQPTQGFVLSRVDGSSRVREIASLIPPSEEDDALRFLFGLLILGLVRISPPLGPGPLLVRELMAGDREGIERAERESSEIKTMYRSLAASTPLDLLGVKSSATSEAIREAFEARKAAFHPNRFLKKIQEAYREELMLIEAKLLEAYLAMAQDQFRTARQSSGGPEALTVDFDTLSKRKELTKTETQEHQEEQVRRAELFYLKARDYFKSKDFHNAIQYCEQALRGNEGDARYHFLLGQCLVHNPDYRWQKRAEQSLLRAAEIDPWNADHFVHLGNFYRAHKLLRKAKKNFQKATEVMPANAEARRALQEMKNTEA